MTPAPPSHAAIAVTRRGSGPEILLIHGGASPKATWAGLEQLRHGWTLTSVYRRGFAPSPAPPGGRQDFELDAADVAGLLDNRPHVIGHSYGGVAAAIAAIQRPDHVRSLTLLEPALFFPMEDPEVARLGRIGEEFLAHGLDTEPGMLREFLSLAGATVPDAGPLPEDVARGVSRAKGSRPPSEARPQLELLREAGVPSLVASGDHHPAIERMCDAVAAELGAERLVCPGAGHFVAAAPGFAGHLERFLNSAERPAIP